MGLAVQNYMAANKALPIGYGRVLEDATDARRSFVKRAWFNETLPYMERQGAQDLRVHDYYDRGQRATGRIGPDGSFEMSTFRPGDGAAVGPQKV